MLQERSLRAVLLNALMLRDYSAPGAITLLLEDAGLTVTNPGGFTGGTTPCNVFFREPRCRNTLLAGALRRIGLSGHSGVASILRGTVSFGRPMPVYSITPEKSVRLFMAAAKANPVFSQALLEYAQTQVLSASALMILGVLSQSQPMSQQDLAQLCPVRSFTLRERLNELVAAGLLVKKHKAPFDVFGLCPRLAQCFAGGNIRRQSAPSPETRIEALAAEKGSIRCADVINLFSITRSQAGYLLQKLVENGRLIRQGKRRSTEYVPAAV